LFGGIYPTAAKRVGQVVRSRSALISPQLRA